MYKYILIFILIGCVSAMPPAGKGVVIPDSISNTITKFPKDVSHAFGTILVRSDNYKGKDIIVLHGINLRGNGSSAALDLLIKWPGFNLAGDPHSFFTECNNRGFNIWLVQTDGEYAKGEIPYIVDFALKNGANKEKLFLVTNSLGGYGYFKQVNINADLPKLFIAVANIVSGPGEQSKTAPNIAASKVPHSFQTASNDSLEGTSPDVTRKVYAKAKALGGNVIMTEWKSGGHGFPSKMWQVGNATTAIGDLPGVNVFDWFDRQVKAVPAPIPSVKDTVRIKEIVYVPVHDTIRLRDTIRSTVRDTITIKVPAEIPLPKLKETIDIYTDGSLIRRAS